MTKARILATGAYLPSKRLTNADLEKMVDTTDEWISTRTGMKERRIAADDEFASTMGLKAAREALAKTNLKPEDIDLIAVATCTPDYLCPSTAALIQHELGAVNAAAFDFQAACTGYIYGLNLARGFVESGVYKNILLIASEKLSSFVDYSDRNTCILFGDGAAASVISSEGKGLEIEHVSLGTDGGQAQLLTVPGGGCRNPILEGEHYFRMDGREIFKHAVRRMTADIEKVLATLGLTKEDISWMVPHQANIRIIELIAKYLGMDKERIYVTVERYGNTSASSVPIALNDLMTEREVASGERLVLPAFGGGVAWGTAILRQM